MEQAPSESGSPIQGALSEEAARLEISLARGFLVLSAVGLVLSAYTAVFIARPLGLALCAFAVFLICWFSAVQFFLRRGRFLTVFPWLCPLVEITLPTCLVLIDNFTEGSEYALESSVPMQIYQIFVGLAVVRLSRFTPLLVGVFGALQYAAVYFLFIRAGLADNTAGRAALRTDMVLMRAVVVAFGGAAGTLTSVALRGVVGRAQSTVRSRDLFGKYRLEKELAQGGMGVVYKAVYCPEGGFVRNVAIKKIHPHLATQPHLVEAFRQEAELCARLLHPNIVQVLDFGRTEDTFFLAMEFVEGETLLDVMRRAQQVGPTLPSRWVAYVGREVCEGLHFAHAVAEDEGGSVMRIIHRDLNPPNVMVSRGGHVKLMDFGIAKALKGASASMTKSGAGKVGYMSPEQASGGPVDERTDLFAVGIMLWEVMCLRHLFQRDEDAATLNLLLHMEVPPVSGVVADLAHGSAWDEFFRTALDRDPARRFQSAREMRDALDTLLSADGVPHPGEFEAFLLGLPLLDATDAAMERTKPSGPRREDA